MLSDTLSLLIELDWAHLIWPIVTVTLLVGFVIGIRKFGNFENRAEVVGADMNILTFGFGVDLLVELMRGASILPRWKFETPTLVPVILLIVVNGVLYMTNLKLAVKIKAPGSKPVEKKTRKVISFLFGVISLMMLIFLKGLWG